MIILYLSTYRSDMKIEGGLGRIYPSKFLTKSLSKKIDDLSVFFINILILIFSCM